MSKIQESRLGTIISVVKDSDLVLVDYESNPLQKAVKARLIRPFREKDICQAIDKKLFVRLKFQDGDPSTPVVTDIFYSLQDLHDLKCNCLSIVG